MNEWVAVAIVGIIAAYKLLDRWLDTRDNDDRETDTYTTTELVTRDTARDDSERRIPDVQLGFKANE